jgi:hypothetical protein
VATAAKDGRSRLESGRWRSAARWLPERELRWLGSQILGVRATRQAHREDRALGRFARHRNVAAHHACELARERKTEPGPAVAPRGQGIGLGEFLEQLRPIPVSETDSSIQWRPLLTLLACSLTSPCLVNLQALLRRLAWTGPRL